MPDLLWIHYSRPRTAWYELAESERAGRATAWAQVRATSEAAGGQRLGDFTVRGQSDYSSAELWLFPTADDAFDHWQRLTAQGYAEWFDAANSIGARKGDSS